MHCTKDRCIMTTIEIRARNMYDQLSKAEKLAADYLLNNLDHIFRYPLAILAENSGTSQGAWIRLCKAMGFDGIKSLKNALFKEMKDSAASPSVDYQFIDIQDHRNLSSIAKNICASSILAIEDTLTLFQEEVLKEAVKKIKNARRIALFGIHASSLVAMDFYQKLLRIGYPAVYSEDFHVSITIAATLTEKDTAIFFSYSGDTEEVLRLCSIAKQRGVNTIAITRPAGNRLIELADLSLFVSSPQTDKRSGAMSSRLAQLVVSDILFTALVNQNYKHIKGCLEDTYHACRPGNQSPIP